MVNLAKCSSSLFLWAATLEGLHRGRGGGGWHHHYAHREYYSRESRPWAAHCLSDGRRLCWKTSQRAVPSSVQAASHGLVYVYTEYDIRA